MTAAELVARGVALRLEGRLAAAGEAFEAALQLDPQRADAATCLAMVRLAQGREEEGWRLYGARWRHAGWPERMRHPPHRRWDGRAVAGLRLWLCNSGTGEFGHVELDTGRFVPLSFCAGYMRGPYFHGDFALIGLSKPRRNKTFAGLPLDEQLRSRHAEARCGVQVVDLRTGDAVHWLRFEGIVDELYDVVGLPGVQRPMALRFKTDEIRRVLSIEP